MPDDGSLSAAGRAPVGRNVMIIGSPGSGKSTLAREIGRRLGLRVVHIDQLYWLPGWRMRPPEEMPALVEAAVAEDGWVFEGNNSRTLPIRAAKADTLIWLDLPRLLCTARVLRRIARSHGRVRPDMAADCPERLDWTFVRWTWDFPRHSRPSQARFFESAAIRAKHRLTSPRAVAQLVAALPGRAG